jgi:hypothetical protein
MCVLLVEGADDKHFCYHFMGVARLPKVEVKDALGWPGVLHDLKVRVKGAEAPIGLIVDADNGPDKKLTAICQELQKAGYPACPKKIDDRGLIVEQFGYSRVGIWLMPDNSSDGMLEHFVENCVDPNDPLFQHARNVVAEIPDSLRKFKSDHKQKAVVHTWLAWQAEPGTPIGQAYTKRYLSTETDAGKKFQEWWQQLFADCT